MKHTILVITAALAALRLQALTVTIDIPSPAAERDFAYHVGKMGASANVSLAVAKHPNAVKKPCRTGCTSSWSAWDATGSRRAR